MISIVYHNKLFIDIQTTASLIAIRISEKACVFVAYIKLSYKEIHYE